VQVLGETNNLNDQQDTQERIIIIIVSDVPAFSTSTSQSLGLVSSFLFFFAMAPARQQPVQQFQKDEKVLCFHMDMLYEAKVMDVQAGEKPGDGFRYKVHYKGWKNTWDDWVLADRIRPFDDEHKELAAQLHAQLKSSTQKSTRQLKKNLKSGGESSRGSEERGSAAVQGGRGGRRGKDWELEQAAIFSHSVLPSFALLGHYPERFELILSTKESKTDSLPTYPSRHPTESLFIQEVPVHLSCASPYCLVGVFKMASNHSHTGGGKLAKSMGS
jgi:hypothetical protein